MKETTWEQNRELQPEDYEIRLEQLCDRVQFEGPLFSAAKDAIKGYSNELPYHNIDHMFMVAEETLALCAEYGLSVEDTQMLVMAALWHDYDYKTPLQPEYDNKEQRSAVYAYGAITKHSNDNEVFAESVASLIISTHESETPCNLYEAILNSADLSNLQGPSRQVLLNTLALFVESRLLAGEQIVGTVSEFIESQNLALTQFCEASQTFLQRLITTKFGTTMIFGFLRSQVDQITVENLRDMIKSAETPGEN